MTGTEGMLVARRGRDNARRRRLDRPDRLDPRESRERADRNERAALLAADLNEARDEAADLNEARDGAMLCASKNDPDTEDIYERVLMT